jgi:hypothetical protein
VTPPRGYVVSSKEEVEQILAVEAELLRSEGVDPRWPGFAERPPREHEQER